jgi:hypothetical protein
MPGVKKANRCPISVRDMQILQLLAAGYLEDEIGELLTSKESENEVRRVVLWCKEQLGAANNMRLIAICYARNWITREHIVETLRAFDKEPTCQPIDINFQ